MPELTINPEKVCFIAMRARDRRIPGCGPA